MRPLVDRLKEKADAELKQRMRCSGKTKFIHFGIPKFGYPHVETEGDEIYLKQKAESLDLILRTMAPHQFREQLLIAMNRTERDALPTIYRCGSAEEDFNDWYVIYNPQPTEVSPVSA